jgi:hypothetical protein
MAIAIWPHQNRSAVLVRARDSSGIFAQQKLERIARSPHHRPKLDPSQWIPQNREKDRKNIWNSLSKRIGDTTYRRYDVSKIAKTDSTSVFSGVFPGLLEYVVL